MKKNRQLPKLQNIGLAVLLCAGIVYALVQSAENPVIYGSGAAGHAEGADTGQTGKKAEKEADRITQLEKPLIQTVSEWDEAVGLIHLGLLETKTSEVENPEIVRREAGPSITEIIVGEYYGSGVIIAADEENITICSNRHLLQYGENGKVTFYDKTELPGKIIGVSEQYDVGFIRVPTKSVPLETLKNMRYVSVDDACYYSLEQGDDIVLIGSSDGAAQSIYEGTIGSMWYYIEDLGGYMLYNYCYAKPGMSGGGTFDSHGHYIGMITGGNGSESASLPLPVILGEYQKITGAALEFSVQ